MNSNGKGAASFRARVSVPSIETMLSQALRHRCPEHQRAAMKATGVEARRSASNSRTTWPRHWERPWHHTSETANRNAEREDQASGKKLRPVADRAPIVRNDVHDLQVCATHRFVTNNKRASKPAITGTHGTNGSVSWARARMASKRTSHLCCSAFSIA